MAFTYAFSHWEEDRLFGSSEPSLEQIAEAREALSALSAGAILARKASPEDYLFSDGRGSGIFSTIDFCQVFGETGAGKTLWAMSLAVSIAAGSNFLNWNNGTARRVVYVDGELAETTIRQRIDLAMSHLPRHQQKLAKNNLLVFGREPAYQILGESPRVCRRLSCLSQATMADSSSWR